MKKSSKIIILSLVLLSFFIGTKTFASVLPIAPATFETGLAFPLAITDTSLTLASANLTNGSTLSGFVCLTIDIQQPNTEYVCGTASSTSPTTIMNLTRGIDTLDGTTSVGFLIQSHRRGADVRITNYPLDTLIGRLLSGITTLDNILSYTGLPTFTGASQLVDKNYVDNIAFSGAGVINATTGARGIVQIATSLQTASSTATGSSGALLVIPSSEATSTFNSATAPLRVVVTNNAGTIDPNFLNLANYTGALPASIATKGMLIATTSQTFYRPLGITSVNVQCVGGGAAGGGFTSTSNGAGSGGGAGGYVRSIVDLTSTPTVAITIGAGGVGNSTSPTAGGTTSFGSFLSVVGGQIGSQSGGSLLITNSGGGGGATYTSAQSASTTIFSAGGMGGTAFGSGATSNILEVSGFGGASFFGGGGYGQSITGSQSGQAGLAGIALGSGGSGAVRSDSGAGAVSGGNGQYGACVITW